MASEVGVSTGLLNHYFRDRRDMLVQALIYSSEQWQEKEVEALKQPAGWPRLEALLAVAVPDSAGIEQNWRVWAAAWGEAVRSRELRDVIGARQTQWYQIIDKALEGLVPARAKSNRIPIALRFDALLTGLTIQAMTVGEGLSFAAVRAEMIDFVKRERSRG